MVQETITANTEDDSIALEFQRSDGTLITLLLDFRHVSALAPNRNPLTFACSAAKLRTHISIVCNAVFLPVLLRANQEVQILKALVLGEEERGQSQYQVLCFVTKFDKTEFISTDAMAKLRQVS